MKSRADLVSFCIAIVVTLAGGASLFTLGGRALHRYASTVSSPVPLVREHIAFLDPLPAPVRRATPAAVAPRTTTGVRSGMPATVPPPVTERPDTGVARVVPSTVITPSLTLPPARPGYLRTTLLPPKPRNPFMPAPVLSKAGMDSALGNMRDSLVILGRLREMTVAERDSLMRVMATARVIPGRAPQMPGYPSAGGLPAGGGISAPLFSKGPSAAERRRDSAANVEYLARLRRLQDRVQARRESVRVADSMSRARNP